MADINIQTKQVLDKKEITNNNNSNKAVNCTKRFAGLCLMRFMSAALQHWLKWH